MIDKSNSTAAPCRGVCAVVRCAVRCAERGGRCGRAAPALDRGHDATPRDRTVRRADASRPLGSRLGFFDAFSQLCQFDCEVTHTQVPSLARDDAADERAEGAPPPTLEPVDPTDRGAARTPTRTVEIDPAPFRRRVRIRLRRALFCRASASACA